MIPFDMLAFFFQMYYWHPRLHHGIEAEYSLMDTDLIVPEETYL